jgi:hypothetical protein
MEHLRSAVAGIVGVVAIFSLMAILVVSSKTQNQPCGTGLCSDVVQRNLELPHAPRPDAGKIPTLAPPRIDDTLSTADNSLQTPLFGQSVYVQVKTDRADIEVGWASGELLGR